MKQRKRFISLKHIATLATAALVTITAVTIGYVSERNAHEALMRETQARLFLEARNLAITSSDALLTEFPELTLNPLVKDMLRDRPEILNVCILNHENRIQGAPDPRQVGQPWQTRDGLEATVPAIALEAGERLSASEDIFQVECPVKLDDVSRLGTVIIQLDRSFIRDALLALRKQMLTLAGGLLLGAVLVTLLMMGGLFRPLKQVREGLIRIGRGDLDTPMAVNDFTEMGLLADTVNQMSEDLKASRNLAEAREQEIRNTQKEVIVTLGQVVESRSSETANHTIRVAEYSHTLARLVGLDRKQADLIRLASPMHDVGKIGIPDAILNKPGKLTDEEFKAMQAHPEIGHRILAASEREVFKVAATIAHEHHEKWNGRGYPRGISGEKISLEGRIVALADVFDAIFSDRVYRKAMPLEKVLGIIKSERGEHFDPRLVDLFLENLKIFLAIAEKYEDRVQKPETKKASPAGTPPAHAPAGA